MCYCLVGKCTSSGFIPIFRTEEQCPEEVVGGWRRLHNEELHNLYTSQNIIRVIKSRRMRWVGHVACMG